MAIKKKRNRKSKGLYETVIIAVSHDDDKSDKFPSLKKRVDRLSKIGNDLELQSEEEYDDRRKTNDIVGTTETKRGVVNFDILLLLLDA